jgi:signal peptidase I
VKKLGHICSVALAVVLFSTCLGLLAIRTLGMGTFVVTGSSMEPAIQKGALVIVEPVSPSAVSRGDIITFEHYGQMTTHRVIAIDGSNAASPTFTTKGDANTVADPEPVHFPGQVGVYRASIPLLGYAIAYAQAYWRLALTVLAAIAFLLCGAMLVFGNAKAVRPKTRRQAAPVLRIDSDELWASHIGWLREATADRIAA